MVAVVGNDHGFRQDPLFKFTTRKNILSRCRQATPPVILTSPTLQISSLDFEDDDDDCSDDDSNNAPSPLDESDYELPQSSAHEDICQDAAAQELLGVDLVLKRWPPVVDLVKINGIDHVKSFSLPRNFKRSPTKSQDSSFDNHNNILDDQVDFLVEEYGKKYGFIPDNTNFASPPSTRPTPATDKKGVETVATTEYASDGIKIGNSLNRPSMNFWLRATIEHGRKHIPAQGHIGIDASHITESPESGAIC
ncbi:hypothetical protein HDU76_001418 [Blyttiomyces sp. JEL0837]|nr:hypothetical protein HDU76_001418 [Blyttiomyces sp. JEL0837]